MMMAVPASIQKLGISPNNKYPNKSPQIISVYRNGVTNEASITRKAKDRNVRPDVTKIPPNNKCPINIKLGSTKFIIINGNDNAKVMAIG